jgi:hypothetical protein
MHTRARKWQQSSSSGRVGKSPERLMPATRDPRYALHIRPAPELQLATLSNLIFNLSSISRFRLALCHAAPRKRFKHNKHLHYPYLAFFLSFFLSSSAPRLQKCRVCCPFSHYIQPQLFILNSIGLIENFLTF